MTRRHSRDDPRKDFGEDVGVGVGVVECGHYGTRQAVAKFFQVQSLGKNSREKYPYIADT